jgi:hypothetical protein
MLIIDYLLVYEIYKRLLREPVVEPFAQILPLLLLGPWLVYELRGRPGSLVELIGIPCSLKKRRLGLSGFWNIKRCMG